MNEIKTMLSKAIEVELMPKDGAKKQYSIDHARNAIIDYVSQSSEPVNENNRYETYYFLLGKATIIAKGWKINRASSITNPFQTADDVTDYIKQTYGG